MIKRDREPGGGRKPKRRREVTYDEDRRGYRAVDDHVALARDSRFIAANGELLWPFCNSAAINSRVIDGAISGATRGRILGVCRVRDSDS